MSLKAPIGFEAWRYPDRRLTRAPVLKRICWSGADGDASFTPATATTYTFPRSIMFYRNLVIGSLATLKPPAGYRVQILCVSDTLQLDGTIDVSGLGGAGGPGGGAGGGGVIVVARKIVGTGIILANGLNGTISASSGGGGAGMFKSITIPSGTSSGGGGAGIWGNGANGYNGAGGISPKDPRFLLVDADIYYDGYGAGGGGGGVSCLADGDGAGGGGGGLIIIMSENSIPGITLSAAGGNGGGTGICAGGGGGGGLIIVVAPSDSSTKNVSGGTGRATGGTGLALFIQAHPYEVI